MQRGDSAQGWAPRGDGPGVLQLRLPQRLPPRLHPCQGRLGCGAAVPVRARPQFPCLVGGLPFRQRLSLHGSNFLEL